MYIRNTTDFDTSSLRSLLRSVVREVEGVLAKSHPRRHEGLGLSKWTEANVHNRATFILEQCDVWIRQRRPERALARQNRVQADHGLPPVETAGSGSTTGRAMLSGGKLRLTLGDSDMALCVWIMRHEVWHLFGVEHEHFPAAIMHADGGALAAVRHVYDIAEGQQIPLKPAKVAKVKPALEDRAATKLVSIVARKKAWTTKLRRAQTALAKLSKQTRYYEKQIAVAASRGGKATP